MGKSSLDCDAQSTNFTEDWHSYQFALPLQLGKVINIHKSPPAGLDTCALHMMQRLSYGGRMIDPGFRILMRYLKSLYWLWTSRVILNMFHWLFNFRNSDVMHDSDTPDRAPLNEKMSDAGASSQGSRLRLDSNLFLRAFLQFAPLSQKYAWKKPSKSLFWIPSTIAKIWWISLRCNPHTFPFKGLDLMLNPETKRPASFWWFRNRLNVLEDPTLVNRHIVRMHHNSAFTSFCPLNNWKSPKAEACILWSMCNFPLSFWANDNGQHFY
jgi:hypothetical protein